MTHAPQYPPKTERVHSYMESRGGRFNQTVFFGLQYYLMEYLQGSVVTQDNIDEAAVFCKAHFGSDIIFNRPMWDRIVNVHHGKLPLRIRAVAEGTVVPVSNVLMTVENTDPLCYPLTNIVETLLLKTWYPITVATLSREIKALILKYLEETGDPNGISFKLHDFGYRGVSSEESAAIGGASHLLNFMGTDTIAGIRMLQQYYGSDVCAFSIPAAEHSTITSWGPEQEKDAYENMLNQFPDGLVAIVSDSYNIINAVENIFGKELKDRILKRNGTVVIRPDSGRPKDVVLEVVTKLAAAFGTETNAKGYMVLNPKVRVIQGDGINLFAVDEILANLKNNWFSADNIAFGMGGALLQQVNRDTQKFAFKASEITVDGVTHDVWKKPHHDPVKISKAGHLGLFEHEGTLITKKVPFDGMKDDLLKIVFEDGKVLVTHKLDDIRKRVATGAHAVTVNSEAWVA